MRGMTIYIILIERLVLPRVEDQAVKPEMSATAIDAIEEEH